MPSLNPLKQELEDLTGSLWPPLRALILSIVSVWLAWHWLSGERKLPLAIAAVVILVAYLCDFVGRNSLPESPRFGLFFMEMWIGAPLMLGATASAALVVISVELWVPESAPLERKQLIGAASAAISGFLTSSFISWAGDKEDSRIAKRIQRVFHSKYKRVVPVSEQKEGVWYFADGSRGEQLIYSNDFAGVSGWGHEARQHRARELAKVLAKPVQNQE